MSHTPFSRIPEFDSTSFFFSPTPYLPYVAHPFSPYIGIQFDLFFLSLQPHFSHMSHTPFSHISEFKSIFFSLQRPFSHMSHTLFSHISKKTIPFFSFSPQAFCFDGVNRLCHIRGVPFFLIRRHTPFSPYVAPRFPHMSEINSLFSFFFSNTPFLPYVETPFLPYVRNQFFFFLKSPFSP